MRQEKLIRDKILVGIMVLSFGDFAFFRLSSCNLTRDICHSLASILVSKPCAIKELDLSSNDLQDKGVAQLCGGLKSPNCQLEVLK